MSNVVALIETKSHNAMFKVSTTSNHEALKLPYFIKLTSLILYILQKFMHSLCAKFFALKAVEDSNGL